MKFFDLNGESSGQRKVADKSSCYFRYSATFYPYSRKKTIV